MQAFISSPRDYVTWGQASSNTSAILEVNSNKKKLQLINCLFQGVSVHQGEYLRDQSGKKYLDLVAGQGTINTGHNHPEIQKIIEKGSPPTSCLPELQTTVQRLFNFSRVVPFNTGVDAYEYVLRLARIWGHAVKNVPERSSIVLAPKGSNCDTIVSRRQIAFPTLKCVKYDSLPSLEIELWTNSNIVAFVMDTFQWNEDVGVPGSNYLDEVRRICNKHNVLWVVDESVSGLGRTGHLMGYMTSNSQPDLVLITNSLGSGVNKVSALMGSNLAFDPLPKVLVEEVNCTNLNIRIALETLRILEREKLYMNALFMGEFLKAALEFLFSPEEMPQMKGTGLLAAIKIHGGIGSAVEICKLMKKKGVLALPCSNNFISITPPLTINEKQLMEGLSVLANVIDSLFERHMGNNQIQTSGDSI